MQQAYREARLRGRPPLRPCARDRRSCRAGSPSTAAVASGRPPIEGLSIPSPQPRAFPRISTLFQGNSKLFQGNSKLFQGNSKLFQTFPRISKLFSLAVLRKIKGLSPGQAGIAFSPNFCAVSAAMSGPAAPCRTRSRFNIARIPIIGKKLSAAISARGLRASAASHAPTRKPTAAAPAPCNFGGGRRRSSWRPRFSEISGILAHATRWF